MAKFSAEKYIEEMLQQPNYLPPDLFIDDRDVPEALNVIDFLHNPQFVGNLLPTKLFPRQVEIMVKTNAEFCPVCTDLDYFGTTKISSKIPVNEPLDKIFDKVVLLEKGICPKCGGRKSDFYKQGVLDVPTEASLLCGQRASKSAMTSMQLSYTTHKFLKVPNLQQAYNLLPTAPFTIPIVAMSFEKARQLVYNAYYEYITKGNWFKDYYEFLREQQARLGLREELAVVKDTFARFRHKNIFVAPFGPDKRKLRGNTSLSAAIDEIGWMIAGTEGGIKFDADEIYTSINNSLMTAKEAYLRKLDEGFDSLPAPINYNISSPSSKKDKICRLVEESKYDRYMFGMHLPTWEVNPNLPLEGPTMQALLKKNSRNFWRDFGAVPPNSSSAFISELSMLEPCASATPNICKINKLTHFIGTQQLTYGSLIITKSEVNKPNRVLAVDAGYKNNSFAFAIAHKEFSTLKEPKTIFDALVEIIPDDEAPLNYSKIFSEVILPMIKRLNIRMVVTDRWQNIKILSDIENDKSLRCKTKTYSVKYGDFLVYKEDLLKANLRFPKCEIPWKDIELAGNDSYPYGFEGNPVAHFLFQNLAVVDMMGKTVTKGEGTTDDIFRAAVLAHRILQEQDLQVLFKGFSLGSMQAVNTKVAVNSLDGVGSSGRSSSSGIVVTGSSSANSSGSVAVSSSNRFSR